jgi:co-chaperonin GroES (HSP10)
MKYTDKDLPNIKNGDLVGFTPYSEYEFIIDGERLYRVLTNQISIKYEYQGNEKEYNPSWT